MRHNDHLLPAFIASTWFLMHAENTMPPHCIVYSPQGSHLKGKPLRDDLQPKARILHPQSQGGGGTTRKLGGGRRVMPFTFTISNFFRGDRWGPPKFSVGTGGDRQIFPWGPVGTANFFRGDRWGPAATLNESLHGPWATMSDHGQMWVRWWGSDHERPWATMSDHEHAEADHE